MPIFLYVFYIHNRNDNQRFEYFKQNMTFIVISSKNS